MTSSTSQEIYRLTFPDYANPPYNHISYGLPYEVSCAKHVEHSFESKRAYIVASTSLSEQTTHVTDLESALGDRLAGTWIGIRPHTPWEDLVPIINDMRTKKADLLITLGGGSLIDGAKLIVLALAQDPPIRTVSDLDALVQRTRAIAAQNGATAYATLPSFSHSSNVPGPDITIPIICIPTTLSAGEYSRFGGGTSSTTHEKVLCTHPKMLPSLVILDPALTLTTPEWVWLSTGVRAIDHCIEAMTSPSCPTDAMTACRKALRMLIPNLLKTKAQHDDVGARLLCQLATSMVLVILLYMPGLMLSGASHGIGHQLGPMGVGHGQTSCILLPAVLKWNESVNKIEQEDAKAIVWSSSEDVQGILNEAGLDEKNSSLGDALDVLFRKLGMPRTLKEVGVEGQEKLDIIAKNSIGDPCTMANARVMDREELVMEVLEMVRGSPQTIRSSLESLKYARGSF